jgi:hypothetical protein
MQGSSFTTKTRRSCVIATPAFISEMRICLKLQDSCRIGVERQSCFGKGCGVYRRHRLHFVGRYVWRKNSRTCFSPVAVRRVAPSPCMHKGLIALHHPYPESRHTARFWICVLPSSLKKLSGLDRRPVAESGCGWLIVLPTLGAGLLTGVVLCFACVHNPTPRYDPSPITQANPSEIRSVLCRATNPKGESELTLLCFSLSLSLSLSLSASLRDGFELPLANRMGATFIEAGPGAPAFRRPCFTPSCPSRFASALSCPSAVSRGLCAWAASFALSAASAVSRSTRSCGARFGSSAGNGGIVVPALPGEGLM